MFTTHIFGKRDEKKGDFINNADQEFELIQAKNQRPLHKQRIFDDMVLVDALTAALCVSYLYDLGIVKDKV